MATYTVTTGTSASPAVFATLGVRATADVFNVNGGYLRVDCDSRYGVNGAAAASFGNITLSATLGGSIEFNSTKVRLIPFNTGTGNVPAADTAITQGSASGKLIGVYSALNVAPTAVATAMPVSGFIKIREWNSVSYTATALAGVSANATAADGPGWLELVGVEASIATVNRLNQFITLGDWYIFQGVTTTGANSGTYQIPTNGSAVNYFPGVWVETAVSSGVYEFYPCAGSRTALAASISTDAVRGKVCWVEVTTGLVRFGSDGTNTTGGYVPVAGCKIRIPNLFFVCCVAAGATNALPNASLATRYKFSTSAAGVINFDRACFNWNLNFQQPYAVTLSNVGILTQLVVQEVASPLTWSNVGVGQEAANTQNGLSVILCGQGGTMTNCTWTRATAAATSVIIFTDVSGFTITGEKTFTIALRTGAATTHLLTRVNNCTWTGLKVANGTVSLVTCADLSFLNTTYWDHPATSTATANPLYAFNLSLSCARIKVDGLDFGGLTLCQPYSGVMNLAASGNTAIKLRNLGTAAAPLDMGGAKLSATFTQATTVITVVTSAAHNLKVADSIYVEALTPGASTLTVGLKTVATVVSATSYTITVATGTETTARAIVYYPVMSAVLANIVAGHNGNDFRVQRCYVPHLRTNLIVTGDNSQNGLVIETVVGDYINAPTSLALNQRAKQLGCSPSLAAQSAVYGTHWLDYFFAGGDGLKVGVAWTQSTTTASITSVAHGLRTGLFVNVYTTSNSAIIVLGQKTVTVTDADTFTFGCLTGVSSGTISYAPMHGSIALLMNEKTSTTSSVYTLDAGTPAFTSAGSLYMPNVGDQVTFTNLDMFLGHAGFPIAEAVMAGGTIDNYDVTYSMDGGTTFKNMYLPKAGTTGVSGTSMLTVTSATGILVNDYVWGTGVAPNAKVASIAANVVTVDSANIGTVTGIVKFNSLPSEVIANALVGFNLKIRLKTTTANVTAITSLLGYTYTTTASRVATYPLDTLNLTLTGLQAGSDIVVLAAGTSTERLNIDANASSSYTYTYSTLGSVDIGVFKVGYVPFYVRSYSLSSLDASLPIAQVEKL